MRRSSILLVGAGLAAAIIGASMGGFAGPLGKHNTRSGEVDILLVVADAYGANYNLIRDAMELYGWNLTLTGVTPTVNKCFYGSPLTVDVLIADITDVTEYDVLAIMPGRGRTGNSHAQLLESPEAIDLVAQAANEGLLVVSFCGGTRVLAAADVINGVHVTGYDHPTYIQEYEDAGAIYVGNPVPPVLDGNILTSVRNQFHSGRICEMIATAVDSLRAVKAVQ
jgi:putative intracellular protease/amidase